MMSKFTLLIIFSTLALFSVGTASGQSDMQHDGEWFEFETIFLQNSVMRLELSSPAFSDQVRVLEVLPVQPGCIPTTFSHLG